MRRKERRTRTIFHAPAILLLLSLNFTTTLLPGQDTLPETVITISSGTASVQQVLERITLQTGYLFTYNADLIDGRKQVNFQVTDMPLTEALDSLLQTPGLEYRVIDRNIVIYQRNEESPSPLLEEIDRDFAGTGEGGQKATIAQETQS